MPNVCHIRPRESQHVLPVSVPDCSDATIHVLLISLPLVRVFVHLHRRKRAHTGRLRSLCVDRSSGHHFLKNETEGKCRLVPEAVVCSCKGQEFFCRNRLQLVEA